MRKITYHENASEEVEVLEVKYLFYSIEIKEQKKKYGIWFVSYKERD